MHLSAAQADLLAFHRRACEIWHQIWPRPARTP